MYKHEVIILMKEINFLEEKYYFYNKQFSECFDVYIKKHSKMTNSSFKDNNIINNSFQIIKKEDDNYHFNNLFENFNNNDINIKHEKNNNIDGIDLNYYDNLDETINVDNNNELENFKNLMKKKIALKTHPDLFNKNNNTNLFSDKINYFIKSQKYFEDNNLFGLIEICYNLDINIYQNITKSLFKILLEENNKKKEHFKKFICWIWFEDKNNRMNIRNFISKLWNVSVEELIKEEELFEKSKKND